MTDFSSVPILQVWCTLGGPEPRRGRSSAFWRGSSDLNISINGEKNVFFDNARGEGGGVLGLVCTVLSCDGRSAFGWLVDNGFLKGREMTKDQKREFARRIAAVDDASRDIANWRAARISRLNDCKRMALRIGDDTLMQRCAPLAHRLENGSGAEIALAFFAHKAEDPEEVERLISVGREDEEDTQVVAALLVFMLAFKQLAEDRVRNAA